MQKTVAKKLNVDPTLLCSAERGARGPLDAQALQNLAALLDLSPLETEDLNWAARHDRAIGALRRQGLTETELCVLSVAAFSASASDQRGSAQVSTRACSQGTI